MGMLWDSDLSIEDVRRYSRQIILPKINIEGQMALNNARVLIIGMGGLGSPVLMYLATTGIRTIGIADHDRVELHNLQRQVIHNEGTIGKYKTESAAEFVSSINSGINIKAYAEYISRDNIEDIVREYDVVVDCCDDVSTRYVINDACRRSRKDLICASALGWEGQLCVIPREGACYRCMFPKMKLSAPSCDTSGVMGPVCGIIGSMQASEVVKHILRRSEQPDEKFSSDLILFNGFVNNCRVFRKTYHPCALCRGEEMGVFDAIKNMLSTAPVKELKWCQIMEEPGKYSIIDIRSPAHFRMFRVAGSQNMPNAEYSIDRIRELGKPVVVSCYRGCSSVNVVKFLSDNGIEAYNAIGGIRGFEKYSGFS